MGQSIKTWSAVGGFGPTFLELNAGAVIAPLWSVFDTLADKITEEFYDDISADPNVSFAATIQKIRSHAYKGTLNPDLATYAAYCFYGDPLAKRAPATP